MTKKYYFVHMLGTKNNGESWMPLNGVTEDHPAVYAKNIPLQGKIHVVLVSWQEITEQEYDLIKSLNS